MRIRTIKPEFWSHPVMARQDDATKLLAIGLLNYADDEGYFYADANLIRSALRPFDDDSTTIRRSIEKLSEIGFVEVVELSSHGPIARIVSFTEHQRVDRPKSSKIKALFESTKDRRRIDEGSTLEGKGKEGKVHTPPHRAGAPEAEPSPAPLPRPGFPTKDAALSYCEAQGWPVKSGLAFWLHYDQARSNGDRAIGPHWHWWSALERWVINDAAGNVAPASPGRRGAASPARPGIDDFDRADDWTPEQNALGPARPAAAGPSLS